MGFFNKANHSYELGPIVRKTPNLIQPLEHKVGSLNFAIICVIQKVAKNIPNNLSIDYKSSVLITPHLPVANLRPMSRLKTQITMSCPQCPRKPENY